MTLDDFLKAGKNALNILSGGFDELRAEFKDLGQEIKVAGKLLVGLKSSNDILSADVDRLQKTVRDVENGLNARLKEIEKTVCSSKVKDCSDIHVNLQKQVTESFLRIHQLETR